MNNQELKALIAGFEQGTWPVSQWTHHCHIYMALWYLSSLSADDASIRIKEGIKKYNVSQEVDNTSTGGYHETITEFYIRILTIYMERVAFDATDQAWSSIQDQAFMDKNFPLQFYSEACMMTPLARSYWCEPDLKSISTYESTPPV